MNESHATEPTTAPPEPTATPAEPAAAHVHDATAVVAEPDLVAAAAAAPEASDESGVAAVELNPAAEPPADPEAPVVADDSGVVPVEINPAAEPPAEPGEATSGAIEEPADDAGAAAAVEINPAVEPPPVDSAGAGEAAPLADAAAVAQTEAAAPIEDAAAAPAAEAAAPATPPAPKQPDPRAEERRQRAQQAWERVVSARESGEVLSGTVTAAVKGGLLVDVGGIRGFLPASQVRVPLGTAIDTLVKTKVPLKVIDIDQARRRIVVSHRRAAEEERRNKRSELLRSLAVGQVREGVVVRLADFGAFVDLGGVDGLIPMRELAFERIDKAGDVVTIGEHLQVEVLRIDENGKKISLSRKNALPDPWRDHADVLRQGSTVQGKVVGKEPRLQVELAPGVVGSIGDREADPADYEIGEAIEVLVRRVDRATRRITLTTMHGAAAVPPPQSSTSSGFAPLGVELGRRP